MQKIHADNVKRIETGALQIDEDWPGLFIRGDDCLVLLQILRDVSAIPSQSVMLISKGLQEVVTKQKASEPRQNNV